MKAWGKNNFPDEFMQCLDAKIVLWSVNTEYIQTAPAAIIQTQAKVIKCFPRTINLRRAFHLQQNQHTTGLLCEL